MEEWLIPLVAILCGAGLPIILLMVVVVRTTRQRHEERMAMIEKGIVLEEPERRANKYGALRNGLLMVGLAFGAILGVYMDGTMSQRVGRFLCRYLYSARRWSSLFGILLYCS